MGIKIIAKNKKAGFDYHLQDKMEAGLVLVGTEVKSLRAGKVSLAESFVEIDQNNEAWIINMTIGHYDFGNINNHQENRKRKLLLQAKQIAEYAHKIKSSGMTIVPTMIYFKDSRIKLEIALGKGKKLYDKRHDQAQKDVQRKLQRGQYE